jgi:hypothetical protein
MAKKEVKPQLKFTIRINKQPWVVNLYTKSNFDRKWRGCEAITEYEHKTPDLAISFRGPRVSLDTVLHEVLHAFLSYKDYSKLTPHTIEERFCELIGKKHKVIGNIALKIHSKLKRKD